MRTPELTDCEGNSPRQGDLLRLTRLTSLRSGGFLRGLPEDLVRDGEDARVLFVRGTYYRRESIRDLVATNSIDELCLVAEPDNAVDAFAVAVEVSGEKIGYLPREVVPDLQPLVLSRRCRVAARGAVERDHDGYFIAILLAWRISPNDPTEL